jgi:threonylcarbamoyladenosine tRNA methylthiotransferase MtaB
MLERTRMQAPRIKISTLGCRLNQFESDALERLLGARGYTIVASDALADVHILNSCTITHGADRDARQWLSRIRAQAPETKIVVTGCYATADAQAVAALPGVDLVVGNGAKEQLVTHLEAALAGGPRVAVGDLAGARVLEPRLPVAPAPRRSRAYLKIQDGCDYRCAFCIVPTVRGQSRSLAPHVLEAQLDELVAAGVPEIVITGVHLGTYGRDLTPRVTLVTLLESLLPRLGATQLRLSSLDPHEVPDALIDLMAANPERLCRYLHLPVQSCDPGVLRSMRRAHTREHLLELVPKLAARVPGIAIGSDVIVGFPQESDAAFQNTHDTLAALPMSYFHVFSYSPRAGTTAAAMPGHVPRDVVAARSRALRALSARKHAAYASGFADQTLSAVIHRKRHPKTGRLVAVTENYLKVQIEGPDALLGARVSVRLGSDTPLLGRWAAPP